MDNLVSLEKMNDRLFRGIDRDPLELIKYEEGKCQAQFTANKPTPDLIQLSVATSQVLRLENMCMVDDFWNSTSIFSRCVWMWKDSTGQTQLMGLRNQRRTESAMYSELEALLWACNGKHVVSFDMLVLWDGLQRLDRDVRGTSGMTEFLEREGDTRIEQKIP